MVTEAFDGPVLRLSRRMDLLEKAAERRIRRGDALDLIEAVKREKEAKHGRGRRRRWSRSRRGTRRSLRFMRSWRPRGAS